MELTRYDDVEEFAARVLPVLLRDEPRFNLAIAVVTSLRAGRFVPDAPPLLGVLEDGAEGVPLTVTPPFGLLLTGLPEGAGGAVVDAMLDGGYALPLVVGPPDAADDVAAHWCNRTGARVTAVLNQGVYAVDALVPPPSAPGAARTATAADVDLVVSWFAAFNAELDLVTRLSREAIAARVASDDLVLWCLDGEPVSMAGIGGRTPHGARIGPVYTPPGHRGHGYAASATADVTQRCFDAGATQCFLYTDLDNPTSNRLYQRLGYRMIAESREVSVAPAAAPG